jgi:hypothetical protein
VFFVATRPSAFRFRFRFRRRPRAGNRYASIRVCSWLVSSGLRVSTANAHEWLRSETDCLDLPVLFGTGGNGGNGGGWEHVGRYGVMVAAKARRSEVSQLRLELCLELCRKLHRTLHRKLCREPKVRLTCSVRIPLCGIRTTPSLPSLPFVGASPTPNRHRHRHRNPSHRLYVVELRKIMIRITITSRRHVWG